MIGEQVVVEGFGTCEGRTKWPWIVKVSSQTVHLQFGEENRGTENGILAFQLKGPMAGYNHGCGDNGWKIDKSALTEINRWVKSQGL